MRAMKVEYLEPTPTGRARLLAYLVLSVLVLVIGQFVLFPFINSLVPCEGLGWTKVVLLGEGAFFAAWAFWLIWSAWKTIHFQQYPHPGADVYFRTRVFRGWWLVADVIGRMTVLILLGWLAVKVVPLVVHVVHAASIRCAYRATVAASA